MTDNSEREYALFWKGHLIGSISKLGQNDMWYFDAEWHPLTTREAANFAEAIAGFVGRAFWDLEDTEKLVWVEIPDLKMNCTVVHVPVENRITLRMMIHMKPPKSG